MADINKCEFTGRLFTDGVTEVVKTAKKTGLPYSEFTFALITNPDKTNAMKRHYLNCFASNAVGAKIASMELRKGDGVRIDCEYKPDTLKTDGKNVTYPKFNVRWLCRISFAKGTPEEEIELKDVDNGMEFDNEDNV